MFIYGITVPMLRSIPNTRRGIEMRIPTYLFLGAPEIFFPILFVYLALFADEKETGISSKALLVMASNLIPPLAWRVYVLNKRPEWVGRYRDVDVAAKHE
jgi:hypothetical protein